MLRVAPVALLLILCACGDEATETAPPTTAPRAPSPEQDPQVRLTRQFQEALGERQFDRAREALHALDEFHGGQGRGTDGQELDLQLHREALVSALIDEAYEKISGPLEAGPRWNRTWALAAWAAAGDHELDPELAGRLAGLVAYGELWDLDESGLEIPPHEGPQIVLLVDHFALGEAVLEGMLRRWQREHEAQRLRVGVVPITGRGVRVGIRRVPATPEEERAAIQKHADALGLDVLETSMDPVKWLEQHGLGADHNILLLFNEKGLLAGRLAGRILDPTEFEEAVQRLVSR